MTGIASIIYSESAVPVADLPSAGSDVEASGFDDLLAGVSTGVPVTRPGMAAVPSGLVPGLPIPILPTILGECDTAGKPEDPTPAEAIDGDPGRPRHDNSGQPHNDDATRPSFYLSMWQILPEPSPQPVQPVSVGGDKGNAFSDPVRPEGLRDVAPTDTPSMAHPQTAAVPVAPAMPVEVMTASPAVTEWAATTVASLPPAPSPIAAAGWAPPPKGPVALSAEPAPESRIAPAAGNEVPASPVPSILPASVAPNEVPVSVTPSESPAAFVPDELPAMREQEMAPIVAPAVETSGAMAEESGIIDLAAVGSAIVPGVEANLTRRSILPPVRKVVQPGETLELKTSRTIATVPEDAAHADGGGIPVAKEQRVMRDPEFPPAVKSAPADFAARDFSGMSARETGVGTAVRAARSEEFAPFNERPTRTPGESRELNAPVLNPTPAGVEPHADQTADGRETKAVARDVAQVIQQIEQTVERMRSHGGERLEMRVPLEDGVEVVVQLRLAQGEVKALFHSAPEGLRQALENGWLQAGHQQSERAEKMSATVVESSAMQSGTGGFQRPTDQRERNGGGGYPETDFHAFPAPPEIRKPSAPRTAVAPSASLQIYA